MSVDEVLEEAGPSVDDAQKDHAPTGRPQL